MSMVNGVVIALVTNVNDPEKLGRIKVHFPWLDAKHESDWIRIATMMAGNDRGSFFMPEVEDEVLIAFEHGDSRFPIAVGFLWNGVDRPPAEHVRDRILKSKNGHMVRLLDSTPTAGDSGGIVIEDANGNRVTMSNGMIKVSSIGVLSLEGAAVLIKVGGAIRVVTPSGNPI
jgi:uncharacterized protein involved in type VI secretion and phage assembly